MSNDTLVSVPNISVIIYKIKNHHFYFLVFIKKYFIKKIKNDFKFIIKIILYIYDKMSTKTIKIKILNKKPEVPIKSIKPILKWAGGKTQILDKIFTHFPKNINNYYEPFCGGGSVFINLLNDLEKGKIVISGNININDINKNLINLYKFVKNNINELIEELDKIKD